MNHRNQCRRLLREQLRELRHPSVRFFGWYTIDGFTRYPENPEEGD